MNFLFTRKFNNIDLAGLLLCASLGGWFWLLLIPFTLLSVLGERHIGVTP